MKKSELIWIIKEEIRKLHESNKIMEGGLGYDAIAGSIYHRLKNKRDWEKEANKELSRLNLTKNEKIDIMNLLRGEEYFDTGEVDFNEGLFRMEWPYFKLNKKDGQLYDEHGKKVTGLPSHKPFKTVDEAEEYLEKFDIRGNVTGEFNEDLVPGGKGDKTDPSTLDKKELIVGISVEMEHTDDKKKAIEIATDHLTENPKYYSELVAAGIVDEPKALEYAKKFGFTMKKEVEADSLYGFWEGRKKLKEDRSSLAKSFFNEKVFDLIKIFQKYSRDDLYKPDVNSKLSKLVDQFTLGVYNELTGGEQKYISDMISNTAFEYFTDQILTLHKKPNFTEFIHYLGR